MWHLRLPGSHTGAQTWTMPPRGEPRRGGRGALQVRKRRDELPVSLAAGRCSARLPTGAQTLRRACRSCPPGASYRHDPRGTALRPVPYRRAKSALGIQILPPRDETSSRSAVGRHSAQLPTGPYWDLYICYLGALE